MDTGSLNLTLWPLVYSLGLVWTVGGASRIRWLACMYVAVLCVLPLCANNSLISVLSIYVNACLVLRRAWHCLIFWVYRLVVVVGGDGRGVFCGGIE